MMCRKEDFIDKSLPFHLIVLEWALQTAAQLLTAEAVKLERQAETIVQKLSKQVGQQTIFESALRFCTLAQTVIFLQWLSFARAYCKSNLSSV